MNERDRNIKMLEKILNDNGYENGKTAEEVFQRWNDRIEEKG